MAFWAWHMRNNRDWEGAYVYDMLYHKLRRMDAAMLSCAEDDKFLVWQSDTKARCYRSLKIALHLAKELSSGSDSDINHTCLVSSKYKPEGSDDSWSEGLLGCKQERKALPRKLYSLYFKKAVERDEANYGYRKKLFWDTMHKWSAFWWT